VIDRRLAARHLAPRRHRAAARRRFGRYKYIRWIREDDAHELYDLEKDPFELRNLAADPAHAATVARGRETLAALVLGSLGLPVTHPL
jgi:choline-sulfatase